MSLNILILVGGKSERMGHNKALITRPDGTRQIDYLVALARSFSDSVFLSARDHDDRGTGVPVLTDAEPGGGPLAALTAARATTLSGPWLVLGCDLFLLDAETITFLLSQRDPSRAAVAFRNRIDGKPEPLCTIYEESGLSQLDSSHHCARSFLQSLDPLLLELSQPTALDNANTPGELNEVFQKLNRGSKAKRVRVLYFAALRDARGVSEETVETWAWTAAGLYEELRFRHRFSLPIDHLRAARNDEFVAWDCEVREGDEFVFMPPMAGG